MKKERQPKLWYKRPNLPVSKTTGNKKRLHREGFFEHCYYLYSKQGKSLQWIAEVYYKRNSVSRQTLFEAFQLRGWPMRSKRLRKDRIYKELVYRIDSAGLYRRRIGGKAIYLHRLVYEEVHGPIPAGHYVIFKDGNKENITIENLLCLSSKEAKKRYNHANQNGYKRFPEKGSFGI